MVYWTIYHLIWFQRNDIHIQNIIEKFYNNVFRYEELASVMFGDFYTSTRYYYL